MFMQTSTTRPRLAAVKTSHFFGIAFFALTVLVWLASSANSCPFCAGVLPSILDEYNDLSEFHVAICIKCQEQPNEPRLYTTEFIVVEPLKSITRKSKNAKFTTTTFDLLPENKVFLVRGYGEEDEFQWIAPTPIETHEIEYVRKVVHFANTNSSKSERLRFFFDQRDSTSTLIADDCFNELGKTSLEDLQLLKPHLNPELLKESLRNAKHTTDRKRLDWVLLGICGQASDAAIFDDMLDIYYQQRQRESETGVLIRESIGLDAAISTYVTLLGEKGLERIEQEFISNPQCEFSDCFSAILALRVQGDDIKRIPATRLARSLALVLKRHEMADLVVPDLARWEQWDYCDTLIQLYQTSEKDDLRLRMPIINYLRVCPLPQAEKMLETIRLTEPVNYRRATTLFPELKKASIQ
jgi:hypothetical protein